MIDKYDIYRKAMKLRKKFCLDLESPIDIVSIAHSIENLTLVFYPMSENVSGACYKDDSPSFLILLNSNMSLGRQHFSLAHELFHAYYDDNQTQIVCPANLKSKSEVERKADLFASFFLIPDEALDNAINKFNCYDNFNKEKVIKLEQYFSVSHSAMLIRLKDAGYLTESQISTMQSEVKKTARRIGENTALYEPSPESEKMKTYGYYIEKASKLLDEDMISNGYYEELLLDAFREDMVFEADADYEY